VYLLNRYTKEEQGKAPVVTIEGGETFPLYNEGDDKEQFLKELKEYKKKLDEDPENTVDLFEFNTNRILYTGTTSSAYKVYVEEGVDIEKSTNNLNSQIQEAFDFSGLKDDISDPSNDSTNIKTTIRLMQPYGLAYAYVDHVGIQRDYETSMLKTDKSSLGSVLWATVHEVGHQMDIDARAWPEITNNMWANNAHIKQGFDDRVNYTYIYKYLAPEKSLRGFEEMDYFQKLGMFWQLQLKKDTYWAELESLYRKRKPSPNNYQQKKDILATYSSEVLNINLTYYFEKYGFDLSDECKEKLKKYPTSNEKLWYLNSSVMNYEGQGFDNVDTNLDVTLSKSKSNIKLTMNINKSIKNDLLGYEIIKDGKVIGFTTESSYTDNEANDNSKYEVVPYAKNLTTGRNVEISSSTPNISLQQEKVTLKIGEDFNAKDYVKGFTYFGDDITSKIEVDSNVNTNECGTYTVKYTLTNENTTKQKSMEVEVVS
ncbi:MAG: M60 family metallopeptidase, partial [Romboutsia timonensis]